MRVAGSTVGGCGGVGVVRLAVARLDNEHGASSQNSSEGHRVPS